MHMLRRREGGVALTMSGVGKQLVTIERHKCRELQKEGARDLPVQPMAMPGAAADPRPARARPAQSDGDMRGAEAKTRKEPRRGEAEETDFADVHAGLAPAETRLKQTATPTRADAITVAAPMPSDLIAPETAATPPEDAASAEVNAQIESPDPAGAEAVAIEVAALETDAPPRNADIMDRAATDIAGSDAEGDAGASAAVPDDPIAAAVAAGPPAAMPDAPRAETSGRRAMAAAAPSADIAAGPPSAPAHAADRMTAATAPKDVAPVDQPKAEAVAAAETTARRAEAALDRRAEAAAAPSAPPPGAETVQAVRAAPPPVAVPQGPPQPGMADARAPAGEASVAAAADRALAEADTMGFGAGPAERTAAAFSLHAPAADRSQAAAVMAQVAPTLRKGADGATEIRLDPPELGRVRLTLRTDDNGLVAIIQAERPETMDMMRRNADMLMRDLLANGQTKVDLSFGSLGPETGGGGQKEDEPTVLVGLDRPTKAPGADLATQLRLSRAAGGLDIRV